MSKQVILSTGKKRIEYIDLMKGMCIMLVIIEHCHIIFPIEKVNIMLSYFRMPLYFFLSGLFFKEYSCFTDFFIRKFCKLVVPYLFFCFFPYIIADCLVYNNSGFKSFVLMFLLPYNEPLWFLRSLFFTYLLYYLFYRISKGNKYILGIVILVISCIFGHLVVGQHINKLQTFFIRFCLNANIFTSILVLPFFYAAFLIKPIFMKLTDKEKSYKLFFIVFIFSLLIWYFAATSNRTCFLRGNYLGNNYFTFILSALGGIGCLWSLAYIFNNLFYFSYLGRYSLIALGTHGFLCILLYPIHLNSWCMAFIILSLMPCFIFVFKKYFPYFTAQKDILFYNREDKKVHFAPNFKKSSR